MSGAKNASGRKKGPYSNAEEEGDGGSHKDQIAGIRKLLTAHHAEDIVAATRMLRDLIVGNPDLAGLLAAGSVDEEGNIEKGMEPPVMGWELLSKNPRLWKEMYQVFMDRTIGRPVNPVDKTQGSENAFGILSDLQKLQSDGVFSEIQGIAFRAIGTTGSPEDAGNLDVSTNGHRDPQGLLGESGIPPRLADESEAQQEDEDESDSGIG